MSDEGFPTAVTRIDTPRRHDPQPAHDLATRLGHFQLLETIGRGGMGTVYSAYDLNLDRKVAIKVLADQGLSEDSAERSQRLVREAQAMAKLSHPNVVPVYEVGIDHGTVFIAMEHVAGLPLDEWLARKPGWRAIVDVFARAGRGLAAAHEAGIVHRDFKPGNVLVDARGEARVTDFGIAQIDRSPDHEPDVTPGPLDSELAIDSSTPLTRRGAIVGTPAYMSPEQYQAATVDARSDQFSFCVALYEALFWKRPFAGRHLELADNVKLGRIEKPDPGANVPSWLTAIVLRGLSVDPTARFPSMSALVDALSNDPSRRRQRFAIGALGAVTIAGIAALAGRGLARDDGPACNAEARMAGVWDDAVAAAVERAFTATAVPYASSSANRVKLVLDGYRASWLAMRSTVCTSRGEQSERVRDLQSACLDRRLAELRALTSLLAIPADARTVEKAIDAASSLTSVASCTDTSALLDSEHAGGVPTDPRHQARRAELDRLLALRRLGRFKEALTPARALVADGRADADLSIVAETLELQGVLEMRTGDLKAAEATLAVALRDARRTGDPDRLIAVAVALIDALREGGISKAREALGVARVAEAVVVDAHDPALGIRLLVTHAKSLSTLGRRAEALPLLREAYARSKSSVGEDHAVSISVGSVLASTLSFNGIHDEAKPLYGSVIATATRTLGALHPATLGIRLDHCRALGAASGQRAAPACYAVLFPDADRVIGPQDRGVLIARTYHAMALMELGRNQQAREVLAEAYRHVPDDAWADRFYVASDIARALGKLELEAGDHGSALTHCERARDSMEKEHRSLDVELCIGEAQLGLGDHARALVTLEAIQTKTAAADPLLVGAWRFAYARAVWAARRDAPQARALAEKARLEVALVTRPTVDAWLAALPRR